jgi:8-oxo-dGTP pyrophosphatase MutT (NUDIX family)
MANIREDGQDLIETHVAGICIRWHRGRWQFLAARRTLARSLFPGKWECGGGQVRTGESFPTAIKRQVFEEFGLDVEPASLVEVYEIHIPGKQKVIPGVRFMCLAKQGRVRLNKREFTMYRWSNLPVPKLDWIPGVKEILERVLTPENLSAYEYLIPHDEQRPPKMPPGFVRPAGAQSRAKA